MLLLLLLLSGLAAGFVSPEPPERGERAVPVVVQWFTALTYTKNYASDTRRSSLDHGEAVGPSYDNVGAPGFPAAAVHPGLRHDSQFERSEGYKESLPDRELRLPGRRLHELDCLWFFGAYCCTAA